MVDSWRSDEVFLLFIHFDRQPRRWGDKLYAHGSVRQSPVKVSEASPRRGSCVIRMSPLFLRQCDVANRKRRHNDDDSLPSLTRLTNNNLLLLSSSTVVAFGPTSPRWWRRDIHTHAAFRSMKMSTQLQGNGLEAPWDGCQSDEEQSDEKPKINKNSDCTTCVADGWRSEQNRTEKVLKSTRWCVSCVRLFSHRFSSFERRQN